MRSRQLFLACVLCVLLHTCGAEEGAETAVLTANINMKFIAIKDSSTATLWLGGVMSRYYVLVDSTLKTATPANLQLYDTDLTTPLPDHEVKLPIIVPGAYYGILKICPSIPSYLTVPNTDISYPDAVSNDTGTIYYYRLTNTPGFYSKTVSILSDDACAADKARAGNGAAAANVAGANVGCLKWEDCPDSCQQFYDGTDTVMPWVLSSTLVPLGNIFAFTCTSGSAASGGTTYYKKVKGDIAALTAAPYGDYFEVIG